LGNHRDGGRITATAAHAGDEVDAANGALSVGMSPDNDVRFGHSVFMVSITPGISGGGETR
jgi:hypothetical protein